MGFCCCLCSLLLKLRFMVSDVYTIEWVNGYYCCCVDSEPAGFHRGCGGLLDGLRVRLLGDGVSVPHHLPALCRPRLQCVSTASGILAAICKWDLTIKVLTHYSLKSGKFCSADMSRQYIKYAKIVTYLYL